MGRGNARDWVGPHPSGPGGPHPPAPSPPRRSNPGPLVPPLTAGALPVAHDGSPPSGRGGERHSAADWVRLDWREVGGDWVGHIPPARPALTPRPPLTMREPFSGREKDVSQRGGVFSDPGAPFSVFPLAAGALAGALQGEGEKDISQGGGRTDISQQGIGGEIGWTLDGCARLRQNASAAARPVAASQLLDCPCL